MFLIVNAACYPFGEQGIWNDEYEITKKVAI